MRLPCGLPALLRQSAQCIAEFDDGMIRYIFTKTMMLLQNWLMDAEYIFNK
jgi:hypothetical protein